GDLAFTNDGRAFRYAQAGGVTLVAGTVLQSPAQITNHQNMTTTTAPIGATAITVAVGATAVTANQYANGYLMINDGTGEGFSYKIASHPANAGSLPMVVTLSDPLEVAVLTADTKSTLVSNQYANVII